MSAAKRRITTSDGVTRSLAQLADLAEGAGTEEKREVVSLGRTLGNLISVLDLATLEFAVAVSLRCSR